MNKSMAQIPVQADPGKGVATSLTGKGKLRRTAGKHRLLAERGMATAEYAVGILAAVSLALVLIKIFNAGSFLDIAMKLVSSIFDKVLGWLP